MAVDPSEIPEIVMRMWFLMGREMARFDNIDEYVAGKRGKPRLPSNASQEVRQIRDNCVHNVLDLVVDAFVQNLAIVGYRDAAAEQDAAGWDDWQRNKMDARQTEIYSAAVKYGVAYVPVITSDAGPLFRPRSPRQMMCLYQDPQLDDWPEYGLEVWVDETDGKPRRKGNFYDDTYQWPLDLGWVSSPPLKSDKDVRRAAFDFTEDSVGDPIEHGASVCPIVRYCHRRDSEKIVESEVERLITAQRAINEVNFDRMIVGRFGAFPQKVISGWTGSSNEVLAATASKVWTFDQADVKAYTLAAASLDGYNSLLDALVEHVASRAQISPLYINGTLVNVNSDTVAAAEANQQRKLISMRDSYGESHEQLLGLSRKMSGRGDADDGAEAIWRDSEARSFGVIADGVIKVAQAIQTGAPIMPLLPLLPGVTPQMIEAMQRQATQNTQAQQVTALINSLQGAAANASQDPQIAALAGQTTPEHPAIA